MTDATTRAGSDAPPAVPLHRSGWVLFALILVAAVANLNLAVANVALPDIGKTFDATPRKSSRRRRRHSWRGTPSPMAPAL